MVKNPAAASVTADDDALFRALIATAVDGIIVIDEEGRIQVYSEACVGLFGYAPEEVAGKNVKMLMPAPYQSQHDDYIAHYLATGTRRIIGIGREVRGRRKDGSTFPMYLSVGEGEIQGQRIFVGIVQDITERRAGERRVRDLQAELLHVARLTDMGQLSSALAHELNQPLSAILNYANAAIDMVGDSQDQDLKTAVARIADQASRAGNIIRRLRALIEKREATRAPEDVVKLVEDAIALGLVGVSETNVKVDVQFEWNLPRVLADKIQIQQVLVNLMRNALDAMRSSEQAKLTVGARRDSAGFVQISVIDTGPGLTPEVANRLFQPFVTTKRDGLGMGLTICHAIIEAHAGRIWVEHEPEKGAAFHFKLPIAPSPGDSK